MGTCPALSIIAIIALGITDSRIFAPDMSSTLSCAPQTMRVFTGTSFHQGLQRLEIQRIAELFENPAIEHLMRHRFLEPGLF